MSLQSILRNPDLAASLVSLLDQAGMPEVSEAVLETARFVGTAPLKGSVWRHPGRATTYVIRGIANSHIADDKFPITVVYEDLNSGELCTRPLWNWKGFVELPELKA